MLEGAWSLLGGLQMLLSQSSLRAILWRMLALLLVIMLVLSGGVFWLSEYMAAAWIPDGDSWYWLLLGWMAWLLALILSLAAGTAGFVLFASTVSAPWLDELAVRTAQLTGLSASPVSMGYAQQILQSLRNALRPLIELMLWGVAALLCLWLPPLATAIWTYGSIRFLSFELIDTAASRTGQNFAERKQLLNNRRWFWLGFSGLAMLMLMVPLLNLLVIPAAVVATCRQPELTGM